MIHQGQLFYITSHRLYDSQNFVRLSKKFMYIFLKFNQMQPFRLIVFVFYYHYVRLHFGNNS